MSSAQNPNVVLLRSADDPDAYLETFAEHDLDAVCVPVLTFRFPFQADLTKRLQRTDRYAHLVLTSPRAATALRGVLSENPSLQSAWEGRTAFAVGPKTASALREVGFVVRGADAGSARALVDVLAENTLDGRLLFLSGNRRRDTLPEGLTEHDVPFDELVVYETHVRTGLDLPPPSVHRWLVFFSPSGLEAVRRTETVDASAYRLAAIGPTTASALEKAGLHVDALAATPAPTPLVEAILEAMDD